MVGLLELLTPTRLRKRSIVIAMLLGFTSTASAAPATQTLRMDPAVIVDATGFEQPIVAATLFLPHGWQTRGGVLWGTEYLCTNGYNFDWSATSPDGSATLAALPQQRWEWNNYGAGASQPGCPIAQVTTVTQALEYLVQGWRPGARVIEHRPRPDLAREYANLQSATPMPLGESRAWVEAAETIFAFDERGRAMRGTVAAVAYFTLLRTNSGMGGTMDALSGTTFPAWGTAAPDEMHDARLYEAIRSSLKTNPQWNARITNHNTQIARVGIEESRKRSEAITRSNAEIARIRDEAWRSYQESADRRAREFSEVIRGVERYSDDNAPGGTVELSNNYEHSWRLNDGSYVLTNDPNFEPWRDLKVEGTKLERAP